jgi:hypothetical protein
VGRFKSGADLEHNQFLSASGLLLVTPVKLSHQQIQTIRHTPSPRVTRILVPGKDRVM